MARVTIRCVRGSRDPAAIALLQFRLLVGDMLDHLGTAVGPDGSPLFADGHELA